MTTPTQEIHLDYALSWLTNEAISSKDQFLREIETQILEKPTKMMHYAFFVGDNYIFFVHANLTDLDVTSTS